MLDGPQRQYRSNHVAYDARGLPRIEPEAPKRLLRYGMKLSQIDRLLGDLCASLVDSNVAAFRAKKLSGFKVQVDRGGRGPKNVTLSDQRFDMFLQESMDVLLFAMTHGSF